jgi:hypothetical protein
MIIDLYARASSASSRAPRFLGPRAPTLQASRLLPQLPSLQRASKIRDILLVMICI